MLFFFISPETALYRDFGKWMEEGPAAMLSRLRYFRRFAYFKAFAAILLSAVIAAITSSLPGSDYSFSDRFSALVWAFSLPLIPQVSGPDREFLRLSLDLKVLNLVTLFQRGLYLVLLLPILIFFPGSFPLLGVTSVLTLILTSWFSRRWVERHFLGVLSPHFNFSEFVRVNRNAFLGFSLGNHISGVIMGWVQTLDLFFLGWFRLPAAEIGIYSVVLKLSNFTLAIPYAVSNFHNVVLGRGRTEHEGRRLVLLSVGLLAFCGLQAWIFYLSAPWILELFSRGRWTAVDQSRMLGWLRFILPASAVFASTLFWGGWMTIRRSLSRLVYFVYVPWAGVSAWIYASAVSSGGADAVARANLPVMGVLVVLFTLFSLYEGFCGKKR